MLRKEKWKFKQTRGVEKHTLMEEYKYLLNKFYIRGNKSPFHTLIIYLLITSLVILPKYAFVFGANTSPGIDKIINENEEDNPFVILEIVPYKGMGEMGYLIGGQEPVKWKEKLAILKDRASREAYISELRGAFKFLWSNDEAQDRNRPSVLTYLGYNEKTTLTDEEKASGNWVEVKDPVDANGKKIANSIYVSCGFINNELFKKEIFGLQTKEEIESMYIQVITKTPEEINQNPNLIDQADLVYLSINQQNTAYSYLWERYTTEGRVAGKIDGYSLEEKNNWLMKDIYNWKDGIQIPSFYSNDLNWSVTMRLFQRVGLEDKVPLIVNAKFTDDTRNATASNEGDKKRQNNIYKLDIMLRQAPPTVFYDKYLKNTKDSSGNVIIPSITEGTNAYGNASGKYNNSFGVNPMSWTQSTFYKKLSDGQMIPTDDMTNPYLYPLGVTGNIYSFTGDRILDCMFNQDKYTDSWSSKYFEEVTKDIINENIIRVNNGLEPISTTLTPAKIIKYIINYKYKRPEIAKAKLTVLYLSPCNDFSGLTTTDILALAPNFKGIKDDIKIVKQTTAEFNGAIEDINAKYDMIYIGLNYSKFNTQSGSTVYNDSNLNGKIYLHVGDKIKESAKLGGMLSSDVDSNGKLFSSTTFFDYKRVNNAYTYVPNDRGYYRYSGNDITKVKYNKLIEYVNSGYPVMLANGFYTTENDKKVVNSTKIDSASYISDFVDTCIKNKKANLVERSAVNVSTFSMLLSIPKVEIEIVDKIKPKEYNSSASEADMYLDSRVLSYKIRVRDIGALNSSSTKYTVKLYIDTNADGRFNQEEEITGLTIRNEAGTLVANDRLMATGTNSDRYYTIKRDVPDGYTGVIPWKLEVTQNSQPLIRNSLQGYTAIKKPDKEKVELKILQVTNGGTRSTLNLQSQYQLGQSYVDAGKGNTREYLENKSTLFHRLTSNLNDFKVKFTTITVQEYENLFKTGKPFNNSTMDNYDATNRLKDYDMLILGFGDMYDDIDNSYRAVDNILDFMEEGKSVLFTHDTTSFVNVNKSAYTASNFSDYWGFHLNRILRDIVGMDRYGVTQNANDRVGKDNARKVNTGVNSSQFYSEIQGYTYSNLFSNALNKVPNNNAEFSQYRNLQSLSDPKTLSTIDTRTNYVTRVNDGQITKYPYVIDDTFQVATTHGQYYQLDLEADDIVVWYCLSDAKGGKVQSSILGKTEKEITDNKDTDTGLYSSSPNDTWNNYYIYNKGNITYSGVGHSTITNDMEAKLFVNTMIAAYNASVKAPKVNVTNSNVVTTTDNKDYLYIDLGDESLDSVVDSNVVNNSIQVKYRVNDVNFIAGSKIAVSYGLGDNENSTINTNITTYQSDTNQVVNKVNLNGEDVTFVESSNIEEDNTSELGKEYYVNIPLSKLEGKNSFTLKIYAKLYYGKNLSKSMIGTKVITIMRRNLFDLD